MKNNFLFVAFFCFISFFAFPTHAQDVSTPSPTCAAPYGNYPACDQIVVNYSNQYESCSAPARFVSMKTWDNHNFRVRVETFQSVYRITYWLEYTYDHALNTWSVYHFIEPTIDDYFISPLGNGITFMPKSCQQVTDQQVIALAVPMEAVVVEYVFPEKNHYFLTADKGEIAFVDSGAAGPWARTGKELKLWVGKSFGEYNSACRFYNHAAVTHFYTTSKDECNYLVGLNPDNDPAKGWVFEAANAFVARAMDKKGACPAGTSPVWRLYNKRWMYRDANNRFVGAATEYQDMINQGWVGEGVVFCQR